jgi:hypothetical protein
MHWLLPFFNMEAKFGPINKKFKNNCVNRDENFQKKSLFAHKNNEVVLEDMKVEPVDQKLRTYKSNWLGNVTRINRTK